MLDRTITFQEPDVSDPRALLIEVLHSSIELLSIEDNDFTWSSWEDHAAAVKELNSILSVVEAGGVPDQMEVSVLFAPTGPIQEVSLSSGWAGTFVKVAERFDQAERIFWPVSGPIIVPPDTAQ